MATPHETRDGRRRQTKRRHKDTSRHEDRQLARLQEWAGGESLTRGRDRHGEQSSRPVWLCSRARLADPRRTVPSALVVAAPHAASSWPHHTFDTTLQLHHNLITTR